MIVESRVGSKGELFLTKELRERMQVKPGDKVIFEMRDETLIVRRIPDLLELLDEPSIGNAESPEEIEQDIEHFFKMQEIQSTRDD
nr:AbrB/MazE/SpoVT family DNA-binding domain-containing protein [Candidatus Sigynarchaeota archaeon]